ncbi:Piso0_004947 [Millerozyma farinosa CBS 7064]|uniref:Piso0_004947 protein n=1 Tax=Pichia sorbitophila (strain ATCC MYA-4447 / BCRC 22081 / CBS 7064 / NBRC 10061 / NRRL Y-12695) TaxID=559304 RepID=G8Y0V4_PICSO|nr:Piso0_004947 [Millerozyma farinosa CBS 7064]
MHVLLTNDDGPLDNFSCPYIKYLVDEINEATDWDLSIVVPNQQRSWIGKAHFAGKTLTSSYIYTKASTASPNDNVNAYEGPFKLPNEKYTSDPQYQEWCLIDSTPAACSDLGIHHVYSSRKSAPVDLVISGPNFGKNSGNLYILSSGTVGAALEAVTHGVKSIAVSFSYNSFQHDFHQIKEAAKITVRIIKKLYPKLRASDDIDLFSINVPLTDSLKLGKTKVMYAPISSNSWQSIYSKGEELNSDGHEQFLWTPNFKQVHKDSLIDFNHTDNRVLLDENVSVTPLKAAYKGVNIDMKELKLDSNDTESEYENEDEKSISNNEKIIFLISIPRTEYIFEPLVKAAKNVFPDSEVSTDKSILKEISSNPHLRVFHYCEYEDIDLDLVTEYGSQYFIPSFIYRKGLIRKHYLANLVHQYVAKNPSSILKQALPETFQLELDYAEFLDDSLDESYELRQAIEQGDKTWILKPSMSDKGQGIRLFKNIDQLQAIFDSFEEEQENDASSNTQIDDSDDRGVIISQLRHFIIQEYKHKPLLLSHYENKKFHLRTYVVCSGSLKVFLFKDILTLFAETSYKPPEESSGTGIDMDGHLTNTCLQDTESALVVPFWNLKDKSFSHDDKHRVFSEIKQITSELFNAAVSVDKMNFQPLRNAIEIYGIDYLVNDDLSVSLLEVNAYPDFKQTGSDLKNKIYDLFQSTMSQAIAPLLQNPSHRGGSLVPVYEHELPY